MNKTKDCKHKWSLISGKKIRDNGVIRKIENQYCIICCNKRTVTKVTRVQDERKYKERDGSCG